MPARNWSRSSCSRSCVSESEYADAHLMLDLCLGNRAPFGLIEFFTGALAGGASGYPGSGGNASVNVDPSGPVRTATVPLLACATPPTIASPSPAPGMPRAAGAR